MRLSTRLLRVGVICILLYPVLIVLRHPHKAHYGPGGDFVFSQGNAPANVRAEVRYVRNRTGKGRAMAMNGLLKASNESMRRLWRASMTLKRRVSR